MFPATIKKHFSRESLASLMWRTLTRYGQFKYRYLLPIYRLFGLAPEQRESTGGPTTTLRGAQAIARTLNRPVYLDQLNTITSRIEQSKGAVIFLPSIGWNVVNTQRTQHLAREFARRGFVAIFDSSDSYDDVSGIKEIEPNLFLIREPGEALEGIADPILWAFTYNYQHRDAYPASTRIVYDWIDDFEVFHFDRDFLERNHRRALNDATVVASVARRLHRELLEIRPDALYLPNAADYDHFAAASGSDLDDPDLPEVWLSNKPLAGYYGALAEWFDYQLLAEVAESRPDWNFVLIGPMYDNSLRERGQSLLQQANVKWIGARDYDRLPRYLHRFDVAMIPFVINNITLATSPLKLYEYFAGGKPVITTAMPECQAFSQVHIAASATEFSTALDSARIEGLDQAFQERMRTLGKENSWPARLDSLLAALAGD
jgi:glycosyltransferase involved in cell wall biosynthesis